MERLESTHSITTELEVTIAAPLSRKALFLPHLYIFEGFTAERSGFYAPKI